MPGALRSRVQAYVPEQITIYLHNPHIITPPQKLMAGDRGDSPVRDTPCKRPSPTASNDADIRPALHVHKAKAGPTPTAKRQSRNKSKSTATTSTKRGWCHWSGHGWFTYDPGTPAECPKCLSQLSQREAKNVIKLTDAPRRPAWWEKSTGNYTWSVQEWTNKA